MVERDPEGHKLKRWEKGAADRVPAFLEHYSRRTALVIVIVGATGVGVLAWLWWPAGAALAVPVALFAYLAARDVTQRRHAILRNFPVLGRLRYVFESIRPELRQYFVESDQEENPYSREKRSVVYQRSKDVLDTLPFGTRRDVYRTGYEWVNHSLEPEHPEPHCSRVWIGAGRCEEPYRSSILNISAMSYGSLSQNAILALNEGAKHGDFAHNTGEGGVSPYHLKPGGDLIWQIGTGYFGCRAADGGFDADKFAETARRPTVKMIEVKLSQGAKPAHGGILPADKVTKEISEIRGVPMGQDVISPPTHRAFRGPHGLLEFVAQLRELSGGKPVGFKMCVGDPIEIMAIVKAMLKTGHRPDFITVDGAEGGTGAAPVEFSNSVGTPLTDGLTFVDNALRGAGVREDIVVVSAGKIATGFHLLHHLALGADACNSARAMMFALGCIQALKCNTNKCPVGVATNEPHLMKGLVVEDKGRRVANFHRKTVESALELVGAAGLTDPDQLRPHHIFRRVSSNEVRDLGAIYPHIETGALLEGGAPEHVQRYWDLARPDSFKRADL